MNTPLPWTLETVPTSIGHCHKIMPLRACLYVDHRDVANKDAKTVTAKADADLIVRAVNSHDALVAACKRFVATYPHGINPGLDEAYSMALDAISTL